jgi:hypothetical protein
MLRLIYANDFTQGFTLRFCSLMFDFSHRKPTELRQADCEKPLWNLTYKWTFSARTDLFENFFNAYVQNFLKSSFNNEYNNSLESISKWLVCTQDLRLGYKLLDFFVYKEYKNSLESTFKGLVFTQAQSCKTFPFVFVLFENVKTWSQLF